MRARLANWITSPHSKSYLYSIAVVFSGTSLVLNYFFRIETERNLFFISMASVVTSASLGGYGPGALATLLTGLGLNLFFLTPAGAHHFESSEDFFRIGVYIMTGLLMSLLGGTLRFSLREMKKAQFDAEEALHSRDEFISIVSHELKSPITALKLQTQLNLRALSRSMSATSAKSAESMIDRAASERMLRATDKTLSRTERLIEDLQDFSRINHGRLKIEYELADLSELAQAVIDRFSGELSSDGIELHSKVEPGIVGSWDPMRIEQVLTNLLSNAIKYGAKKPIEIGVTKTDGSVLLFVRDHGPGILPSDQARVFERFERATTSKTIAGLGLGLYITKNIVHLHHGKIWIETTPGGGATFFVELPLTSISAHTDGLTTVSPTPLTTPASSDKLLS